jgi:hypothetical protein
MADGETIHEQGAVTQPEGSPSPSPPQLSADLNDLLTQVGDAYPQVVANLLKSGPPQFRVVIAKWKARRMGVKHPPPWLIHALARIPMTMWWYK